MTADKKKNTWKVGVMVGVAVLAIALLGVFVVQHSRNKAIRLDEKVQSAMYNIKAQEKKRVDLVYNLADCVKQYDKHEAETLAAIVEGRGSTGDIENVTTAISAVSEAYPELKSNENYKELMRNLTTLENEISQSRINYNNTVEKYNRYVRGFPARMFLGKAGYEVMTYERLEFDAPVTAPQGLFDKWLSDYTTRNIDEHSYNCNIVSGGNVDFWDNRKSH